MWWLKKGFDDLVKKEVSIIRGIMKKSLNIVTVVLVAIGFAGAALTAAAAERDTPERTGDAVALVAGGAVYAGEMVCVWSNSLAYAAADSTNYVVVGRADNSAVKGERVVVRRGVFRWDNRGSFAKKDIGSVCYVWTNTAFSVGTAAVATADVKAGRIVDVDGAGVWVDSKATDR